VDQQDADPEAVVETLRSFATQGVVNGLDLQDAKVAGENQQEEAWDSKQLSSEERPQQLSANGPRAKNARTAKQCRKQLSVGFILAALSVKCQIPIVY